MIIKLYAEKRTKESITKADLGEISPTYNSQYKPLHRLRQMSRLITVAFRLTQEREELKRADLLLTTAHFNMVAENVVEKQPIVWSQCISQGQAKMLGKRIFEERDHKINKLAVNKAKYDYDCHSTKSSSGRPLALAVTGERDRSSPEDLTCLQKKQLAKGGVFMNSLPREAFKEPARMATRKSILSIKGNRKRLKSNKTVKS